MITVVAAWVGVIGAGFFRSQTIAVCAFVAILIDIYLV